jgi:hypothetical protein
LTTALSFFLGGIAVEFLSYFPGRPDSEL